MKRRCTHERVVHVRGMSDEGAGPFVTVCCGCGAVEGEGRVLEDGKLNPAYDGFGFDLEAVLSFRELDGRSYPEGARFEIQDGPPPATAPGDECQGYRLKGPRLVLHGTDRRPILFVQRIDMPGRPWDRFLLANDEGKWWVSAYKTRALAVEGG